MLTRKRCCCGSSSVGCLACNPCPIPQKDLRLTYTHIIGGVQSGTLTFSGSSWHCLIPGSFGMIGDLSCSGAGVFFREQSGGNDCTYPCGSIDNCLILDEFTCNPFSFKFVINKVGHGTDCPGQTTEFTVDDPDAPPTDCPCEGGVHVNGCNGLALAGADVVVKDSGGGTVASGTTDSAGNYMPLVTGFGFEIDVSKDRFNTNAFLNQSLGCGSNTTVGMSGHVASGYQCYEHCADPIAESLTATFSLAGAVTLTYSGGVWIGTFTVAGQSYTVFLSNITHVFGIQRNGSDCSGVVLIVDSCPPSFSAGITIASGTCATELGSTGVLTE